MKQIVLLCLLGISNFVFSQKDSKLFNHHNLDDGLAIQGYDAVTYFTNNVVKGTAKFYVIHNGAKYLFSSETNKNTFLSNPLKYEPQYGGWCAFAMGDNGKKVEIDPKTYKIVDGKLYLFYNAYFNNTLKSWNKDEINLKVKADKNWSNIINK